MSAALTIFARFHAHEGRDEETAALLQRQAGLVRMEPGCLDIEVFRATHDPRLFHLQSRWRDADAFEVHADLECTTRFLAQMDTLLDQPREVTRSRPIGQATESRGTDRAVRPSRAR